MRQVLPPSDDELIETTKLDTHRLVYVIDDNADVRKSLHFALATHGITVWPIATPEDFLDQIDALKPAPVLLDLRMRSLDGMQVLEHLSDRGNRWPVVMFSAYGDIPIAVRAMKLGAVDFIEKPLNLAALLEVLEKSFEALAVAVENAQAAKEASALIAHLTPREIQILRMLVKGSSNKTVADKLELSCRTVEVHRSNALKKLSVRSLTQVANLMLIKQTSGSNNLENEGNETG